MSSNVDPTQSTRGHIETSVSGEDGTHGIMHDRQHHAFALCAAEKGPLVDIARVLMTEYAALPHALGRWLSAADDIAALPRPYVRPKGILLVALNAEDLGQPTADVALACGALGALPSPAFCELKRIYVRPHARGRGIGEAMTVGLLKWADLLGYERVCLDTAPELVPAITLYLRLGFTPISPYKPGLLPDAVCLERPVRV